MSRPQRLHDLVLAFRGRDGLESQLRHALFAAALADRGVGALSSEERSRALRVPGAALVVADTPGARGEQGVTDRVERAERDEDDELPVHQPGYGGFRSPTSFQ